MFEEYQKIKDKHKSNNQLLQSSVELKGQKFISDYPKLEKKVNKSMSNIVFSSSFTEKELVLSPPINEIGFVKTNEENFIQSVSFHKEPHKNYDSNEEKFKELTLLEDIKSIKQVKSTSLEHSEVKVEENHDNLETSSSLQDQNYNDSSSYFEM